MYVHPEHDNISQTAGSINGTRDVIEKETKKREGQITHSGLAISCRLDNNQHIKGIVSTIE